MTNIKITVELCKEDRQRVDDLIGTICWAVSEMKSHPTTQPKIVQAEDGTVKLIKPDHPADASISHLEIPKITQKDSDQFAAVDEAYQTAVAAVTAKQEPVSFPEFQKAVTQTVAKGPKQKEAAKAIINEYAPSVSEVPEDKRAEVMAKLAQI